VFACCDCRLKVKQNRKIDANLFETEGRKFDKIAVGGEAALLRNQALSE
jgi:hypothetical protein